MHAYMYSKLLCNFQVKLKRDSNNNIFAETGLFKHKIIKFKTTLLSNPVN